MNAIVPKLGVESTTTAPATSQSFLSANGTSQAFSATLEQATYSSSAAPRMQSSAVRHNSPDDAVAKRESKSSNSRTSNSPDQDTSQSAFSRSDGQSKAPSAIVTQPTASPAHPIEKETEDNSGATAPEIDLTVSADSGGRCPSKTNENGSAVTLPQDGAISEESSTVCGTTPGESSSGSSTSAASDQADEAAAIAGLAKDLSGAGGSNAEVHHGTALAPRLNGESTNNENQPQGAVESTNGQSSTPSGGVAPGMAVAPSTPGNIESDRLQAAQATSVKTLPGVSPETGGTARRDPNVNGSTKTQSRKDDSTSSTSSQASDQSVGTTTTTATTSATGTAAAFSVPGTQMSPAAGDGQNPSGAASHGSNDQQGGQAGQAASDAALGQTDATAVYPATLVNSAKLVERMGEAELRIGIQAGQFGTVDIRTSMIRNQFTAEISVERGELGRVMAAELPGLQDRLAEQRVPIANITLQNHAGDHSAPSEERRQRDGQQVNATNAGPVHRDVAMAGLMAAEGTAPASRLDIHM
ncbi:MAG: hypothetical protein WAM89_10645 [Terriglobales bacterium]